MENNFVPYLCGGVLFSFLIELKNDTAQNLYRTYPSEKTILQTQIMENLIRAINPNYSYDVHTKSGSFSKYVSEYHTCNSDGGNPISFECDSTRTEFDSCVKKQYKDVLERMTKFTTECFPTCNDAAVRFLVEKILILIRDDSSIDNDTLFFIQADGSPISKEELLKKEDFNFQSFLVGIWHYIITKPTKNENGRQTFKNLFPKYKDKKPKLDTSCLEPYTHDINVTWSKTEETLPKENYEDGNMVESSKTDKKELAVKIYYEGSLLEDEEKNKILSCDSAILDLNENPDIAIKEFPSSTIYKITTDFQFKTHFLSLEEEIIRLYCNAGSLKISGTTSVEKWISRSKLNEMRFRLNYICTAWFKLTPCGGEYSAEFLLIGRIIE